MVSYTVEEIIERCFPGACHAVGDVQSPIDGVSDLASASRRELSFFANMRYSSDMKRSSAGAIIVPQGTLLQARLDDQVYIFHGNPTVAFQAVVDLFHGKEPQYTGFSAVHPTAVIHPTARLGNNVHIGPYVVIDMDVVVGDDTSILPHAYIGRGSKIGRQCIIHAHVVVRERCLVQDRVSIQPGAVIGSCGFGYSTDKDGVHRKLHHWGSVTIEDDVEIGANTTIDRGRFQETKVGAGTKIDNLVQIAHNVVIGRLCLLVSQVGIAGSTKLGDRVVLGGKVGVNGHIEIASGVMIAAYSGVSKSLGPGKYSGIPVRELAEYNKNMVHLRNIDELFGRVKQLEAALSQ